MSFVSKSLSPTVFFKNLFFFNFQVLDSVHHTFSNGCTKFNSSHIKIMIRIMGLEQNQLILKLHLWNGNSIFVHYYIKMYWISKKQYITCAKEHGRWNADSCFRKLKGFLKWMSRKVLRNIFAHFIVFSRWTPLKVPKWLSSFYLSFSFLHYLC